MRFDENEGFWIDDQQVRHVRNEFNPRTPTFIQVSSSGWQGWHLNRKHHLVWPSGLSADLIKYFERVLQIRMRKLAPSALTSYGHLAKTLAAFRPAQNPLQVQELLDIDIVRRIWDGLIPAYRPLFRSFMQDLALLIDPQGSAALGRTMREWAAKRDLAWKRSVLEWDPEQGSLTSAELEVLRPKLLRPATETVRDHFARVFARLLLVTLRRPGQVITVPANGLRRITTTVGTSVDVCIPPAKAQAGGSPVWLPIPNDLADDIEAYRSRSPIKGSKAADRVLLPIVSQRGTTYDIRAPYGAEAKSIVQTWMAKIGVISPRTGRNLHLNLRRLRHTGATHLAMQGYPLSLVQDVLEHQAPSSTRYYVDAVGSE